jgi:DNA sulfur modification protein DndC
LNAVVAEIAEEASALDRYERILDEVTSEYLSEAQRFPWIIGFSGGKDSTVLAQLVFDALLRIPPAKRTRHVHVVANDTRVESPFVIEVLDLVLRRIAESAQALGLPITTKKTQPAAEQSFWVNLIGRGYPSPNITMRWCTDRLKIQPTSQYIKQSVSEAGAAIVLLGVRRDESVTRQRSIDRRKKETARLARHPDLMGAYVFSPIVDLSTDDIWEIIGSGSPPWGGTHKELIALYRGSEGGECPVVMSTSDAPSCGTKSSRFGCWTCTVVEKDRSLQGFVDAGAAHLTGLITFRTWLKDIRNLTDMRQATRRSGKLTFDAAGNVIPGPFTIAARQLILRKLLVVQEETGLELISDEEIRLIHQCWGEDIAKQA